MIPIQAYLALNIMGLHRLWYPKFCMLNVYDQDASIRVCRVSMQLAEPLTDVSDRDHNQKILLQVQRVSRLTGCTT